MGAIVNEVQELEIQALEGIENQKEREMVNRLMRVDGFFGMLESKVGPSISRYQ